MYIGLRLLLLRSYVLKCLGYSYSVQVSCGVQLCVISLSLPRCSSALCCLPLSIEMFQDKIYNCSYEHLCQVYCKNCTFTFHLSAIYAIFVIFIQLFEICNYCICHTMITGVIYGKFGDGGDSGVWKTHLCIHSHSMKNILSNIFEVRKL